MRFRVFLGGDHTIAGGGAIDTATRHHICGLWSSGVISRLEEVVPLCLGRIPGDHREPKREYGPGAIAI